MAKTNQRLTDIRGCRRIIMNYAREHGLYPVPAGLVISKDTRPFAVAMRELRDEGAIVLDRVMDDSEVWLLGEK